MLHVMLLVMSSHIKYVAYTIFYIVYVISVVSWLYHVTTFHTCLYRIKFEVLIIFSTRNRIAEPCSEFGFSYNFVKLFFSIFTHGVTLLSVLLTFRYFRFRIFRKYTYFLILTHLHFPITIFVGFLLEFIIKNLNEFVQK